MSTLLKAYISQLRGNAHKENLKIKVLHEGSNEKKNSEKYLIKIKVRFARRKENIKTLKLNLTTWNKDRWNIEEWMLGNLMSFNEEVEEFTSRWSQSLVNVRNTSYLKQKNFSILFLR